MRPPTGPATLAGLSPEVALPIHATMVRIRVFETRVTELFAAGKLPGFVHTYLGQEAIAAATCRHLRDDDYITSTHRGHGHAVAKGMPTNRLMAELFGRETGANRGRGGSMHVADFSLGMLGANGIVGGGFGIAAGAGLSARRRSSGQVAVCFFGDGGINKGPFHEALNFASVKALPVVFVCENNQYAQFTAIGRTSAVEDLAVRATGYDMPGMTLDGNDAGAVYAAVGTAVEAARSGEGPALLNCVTYRHSGHYVGDAEVYRDAAEVEQWRAADPIGRLELALVAAGWVDAADLEATWEAARAETAAAEEFAVTSVDPDPATALDYVYTPAGEVAP
ncbi:MAG: thiamine pyrophosphate-dependent dehydrogenase E1 component subunit alpha [Acidimicrobiia bacterium]|nr:thiamine pyrophosphate-dependent dehydrogenase E1 component subunit alpha [Acidimicrobiia bacterium]MYC45970.1 thiamine pyrophosphate-dependent dehydrogenase E1 component subunit alpha [Acidimicrobiia bacterium]